MPALQELRAEFVTLLIGVNDVVQGIAPPRHMRPVSRLILDGLLGLLPVNRKIVTVCDSSDYTVTPAGSDYGDPRQQHGSDHGRERNDVPGSRPIAGSPTSATSSSSCRVGRPRIGWLAATDGLHPSGAQYALWVERIVPVVEGLSSGAPSSGRRGQPGGDGALAR